MCESSEVYYCEKCGERQVHLISGSGRLAICLGCGDEKQTGCLNKWIGESPDEVIYSASYQQDRFYREAREED